MGQVLDLICNICAMLKVLQLYDMVDFWFLVRGWTKNNTNYLSQRRDKKSSTGCSVTAILK
jgi:hypothetical protein